MWTGFSVLSMYGFGKRFFARKQMESLESVNINAVNNKKINKKNNKVSLLETKLNKVLKTMKILKKKTQVNKVTPDNNV